MKEDPIIKTLRYNSLGRDVLAKFNERFGWLSCFGLTQKFRRSEPIAFCNVPRTLAMDQILREGNMHILSFEETVMYWDAFEMNRERRVTYNDTTSVAVYPKEGPNEELRQKILQSIKRESTEVPLVVSGLGVEKADNRYGFTLVETDHVQVTEAPYLMEDCNVTYDTRKRKLVRSKRGVTVLAPDDCSGLYRLYRHHLDRLECTKNSLVDFGSHGRYIFVK